MQNGDTVLVFGGAGGIGISAIELAKAYGGRVVAGVSSEAKGAGRTRRRCGRRRCLSRISHSTKTNPKRSQRLFKAAAGPNGYNIIYDTVGGDYSEPAVRSIAWEGRFLVVGFPAGIAKLPLNLTLLKSCDVCGVFWGAYAARAAREEPCEHIAELFHPL
jgi:NADPH:quinone reductase